MKRWLSLCALLLLVPPARAQQPTFAGAWDTTYGRLTLTQEGDQVKGYYLTNGRRAIVEGTVEKGKLTFRYQEPSAAGEGWFELAADGHSFQGRWRERGETEWEAWAGKRVPPPAPPDFGGVWETSYGRMRLVQRGDAVEGIYAYTGESTLTGKAAKGRLTFQYREPAAAGEGWFELAADGNSFQGRWKAQGSEKWADWTGKRVVPREGVVYLVILEANWEQTLDEQEYSFGAMLRAFFARSAQVQVRHRFFTDAASLRRWCREVAFLAEPVVLSLATHGSAKGAEVNGQTIGAAALAESLRYAAGLRLVHFSACEMMKDRLARDLMAALGGQRPFPVSGYTTAVDWAASAIIEFTYFELILMRGMAPDEAAKQLVKLVPFAGDRRVPGAPFASAGFRLLMPEPAKAAAAPAK
jgi:hypothetical protein